MNTESQKAPHDASEDVSSKSSRQSEEIPLYLTGDFSKELNYKLWSTKGARFSAAERMRLKHRLSTRTVSFLATYLIAFNLLEALVLKSDAAYVAGIQVFVNISLSVFILVYSQLESAGNYLLRSHRYHACALEIGKLYSQLRLLKTTEKDTSIEAKVKSIALEYEAILEKHENHEPIDFTRFKVAKPDYEDHALSPKRVVWENCVYYVRTAFFYHLNIWTPPIAIVAYLLMRV